MGWGKVKKYAKRLGKKTKKGFKSFFGKTPIMQARKLVGRGPDKPDMEEDPGAAADQYEMKDVARSRAAGSGVFNYTDQEMRKV